MKSVLFEKIAIGSLELKNRLLMSAAASWKATADGDMAPGQSLIHYEIAKGGTAMIINGGVCVDPSGRRSGMSALFDDDQRIPSFRQFAETVRQGGAAVAFQLTHAGIWAAQYVQKTGGNPFVPSFLINDSLCQYLSPNRQDCPATERQILKLIDAYGDAAIRAKEAGYDAVEIHGGHDSLMAQFLSPLTNLREDDWGGSVEKRCAFHREVLSHIREMVGPDYPVIIKLGVRDSHDDGLSLEEGITAARLIAEAGDVDAIEVTQGLSSSITDFSTTSIKTGITSIEHEAYYRNWTKMVKSVVKDQALVIMQGGLRSFELIEQVIAGDEADLVSMCRPLVREPELIRRWESGDHGRAACISCNKCVEGLYREGKPLECPLQKGN